MKLSGMPTLTDRFDVSRATINRYIKKKLLPKPIKLGFSSRWPDFEIEEVIKARIRGADDDAIRALVQSLETARKNLPQFGEGVSHE